LYHYITESPLENRQSYTYTNYHGQEFLDSWLNERKNRWSNAVGQKSKLNESFSELNFHVPALEAGAVVDTDSVLLFLKGAENLHDLKPLYDFFIQRFEVSKRLFDAYEITSSRPKSKGNYNVSERYVLFAEALVNYLATHSYLPALNALLKVMDTLCGLYSGLELAQKHRISMLSALEKRYVSTLADNFSGTLLVEGNSEKTLSSDSESVRYDLSKNVFIAADTVRTRAYALALKNAGIRFSAVIFLKSTKPKWGQANTQPNQNKYLSCGAFASDLNVALPDLLADISDEVEEITTDTINCDAVKTAIEKLQATFIVFSGYGGEIVDVRGLAASVPMLHIHSGYLPDYRGSTTVYYSILDGKACGASAIILEPAIDEGVILHKKEFSLPAQNEDIDYYYDSFIRADVLFETLHKIQQGNGKVEVEPQVPESGDSYYIIHPVLKHLAIMKVKGITPKLGFNSKLSNNTEGF
jgi:methionyl-tRNA formyltransferase